MATQAIRQEELNNIGQDRLKEAQTKAKIQDQPGYEPPKAPAAPGAAPAALSASAGN